jgi:hypothetical protein
VLLTGEGLRRLMKVARRVGNDADFVASLAKARKFTRGPKPGRALREIGLEPQQTTEKPTSEGVTDAERARNYRERKRLEKTAGAQADKPAAPRQPKAPRPTPAPRPAPIVEVLPPLVEALTELPIAQAVMSLEEVASPPPVTAPASRPVTSRRHA